MACVSQPSPLLAARQRAQVLADSGDLGQARAMLEHAVDLGRANLGEDDPDVLVTAQQLATVYQLGGDPSGARRVLEEAFAAGQWRLGDADPVMLGISFDLGMVAEEMENRHEARRAFGRVVTHGPEVLGADHWAVVRARSYLGEDPPTVRMELPVPAVVQPVAVARVERPSFKEAGQTSQPNFHEADRPVYGQQLVSAPPIISAVPAPQPGFSVRAPGLFAAIAAVFGVIIAVVALVVVLANRGDDRGSDVPPLGGPAPTDVRIRDYGSAVKLFWTDPANGRTSFLVTAGHPGEQLKPMGQVGPTTTSFDLNGLNAELDYCFAIVAVYSTSQFSTSPQTCTSRDDSSPTPKASRRKK
jgi:hypothetical protein